MKSHFRLGTRASDYEPISLTYDDKALVDTGERIVRPDATYIVLQHETTREYYGRDINVPSARLVRVFAVF